MMHIKEEVGTECRGTWLSIAATTFDYHGRLPLVSTSAVQRTGADEYDFAGWLQWLLCE